MRRLTPTVAESGTVLCLAAQSHVTVWRSIGRPVQSPIGGRRQRAAITVRAGRHQSEQYVHQPGRHVSATELAAFGADRTAGTVGHRRRRRLPSGVQQRAANRFAGQTGHSHRLRLERGAEFGTIGAGVFAQRDGQIVVGRRTVHGMADGRYNRYQFGAGFPVSACDLPVTIRQTATAAISRYAKDNVCLSGSASMHAFDVSYWRHLHNNVQMGSSVVYNERSKSAVGSIVYQWLFPDSVVRGMIDSECSTGFTYTR